MAKFINVCEKGGELYQKFIENIRPFVMITRDFAESLEKREKPKRSTKLSAGYDLSAPCRIVIPPRGSQTINFGWVFDAEESMLKCMILPRSSLCKKKGLKGGIEIIYPDRCLSLHFDNILDEAVVIEAGEKIAQAIITVDTPIIFNYSDIQFVGSTKAPLKGSGRDFYFLNTEEVVLEPRVPKLCKTNLKWRIKDNTFIRLDVGTLNRFIVLANTFGIVDADYYGNPDNDGNIGFMLLNLGYAPISVKLGEVLGSGSVYEYFTVSDEEEITTDRSGGFGSTT